MARHVIEQLILAGEQRPDAAAVVTVAPLCEAQRRVTYGELTRQIETGAGALRCRFMPGEVVMLCSLNAPEFIVAFLAALSADLTVFPVHPHLTMRELRDAARKSDARAIIASSTTIELLRELGLDLIDIARIAEYRCGHSSKPQQKAARGGLMLQSSGTTGTPKIVFRSAESLDAVARNVVAATHLAHNDRVLAAMPLCHSYGVENGMLAPILAGATIHLADGFDPASIARHFADEGITVFPGVPFMFQTLIERSVGPNTLSLAGQRTTNLERSGEGEGRGEGATNRTTAMPALRLAYSAGGSLPVAVGSAFTSRFGIQIGQLYGSTEMGSVTFAHPSHAHFQPASVGQPMRDVTIRILSSDHADVDAPLADGEEGLVAITAPSMLDRYVGDASPALNDGFFLTGDLGRLDDDQNLFITGRVKLQIDIGGLKVNPLEVEHVLAQHPSVLECVVVPEHVTHTVNRLKAIIALRSDSRSGAADELREFARAHLAPFKIPRLFEFRDSLPKSPTGKILREALRCGG